MYLIDCIESLPCFYSIGDILILLERAAAICRFSLKLGRVDYLEQKVEKNIYNDV